MPREDDRAEHVHLRQAAAHMADQGVREVVDPLGDAEAVHQRARQHEEGDGGVEIALHRAGHAAEDDREIGRLGDQQVEQRGEPHAEGDRHADGEQQEEGADEDRELVCHVARRSSFCSRSRLVSAMAT
jgi:hypothetical protein